MNKKALAMPLLLATALVCTACQKIEPQTIAGEPMDFGATVDSIPLGYGRLVSAVPVTQHVNVLWFEQDDQTIVGVRVNVSRGTISEEIIRVERN